MQLEHCRELPLVILALGLYIFVRGFGKAYKRRDLYPRGLEHLRKAYWGGGEGINGGACVRGGL